MKKRCFLRQSDAILFVFCGLSLSAYSQIIYVKADAAGANTGTNWTDAYPLLQSALDTAVSGDEIWVAAGTYKPTKEVFRTDSRYKTFQLKNGVGLYGGFAGTESGRDQRSNDPNLTILSGDQNGDDTEPIFAYRLVRQDNCYHVFYHPLGLNLDASAILDGFTIQDGNADGYEADFNRGGGMYNYHGNSPTINHCLFRRNTAISGGGLFNSMESSPMITNCIFRENVAGYPSSSDNSYGGGVYTRSPNCVISGCLFADNLIVGTEERQGGGLFNDGNLTLTSCMFQGNSAKTGGGFYTTGTGVAIVSEGTFIENTAFAGGGMYSKDSSPSLSHCLFVGNSATDFGGGLENEGGAPDISHCVFKANLISEYYKMGGAGICNLSSSPTIADCLFEENNSMGDGGGMLNFKNSNGLIVRCVFIRNRGYMGAGMFNLGSSPKVMDCTFTLNDTGGGAGGCGGGMANIPYIPFAWYTDEKSIDSLPTVIRCTFEKNYASGYNYGTYVSGGGGLCGGKEIVDCVFFQNSSSYGGGVLDAQNVIGCMFIQNEALSSGGGLYGGENVNHCIFTGNKVGVSGGGVYKSTAYDNQSIADCSFIDNSVVGSGYELYGGGVCVFARILPMAVTIKNCMFSGNTVNGPKYVYGGGIYVSGGSLSVSNSVFVGNKLNADNSYGGGIYSYAYNPLTITNCSVINNSANGATDSSGGGIYHSDHTVIDNSILWANSAAAKPQIGSTSNLTVSYSDIQGGWTGDGNIDADPLFADAVNGDLHLQASSPCIDKGSDAAVDPNSVVDMAGSPRKMDGNCDGNGTVDMGAYEYYLPGDLNTTCSVDGLDLDLFIIHWLETGCISPDNCSQADLNRSGVVELADFDILAEHWMQGI